MLDQMPYLQFLPLLLFTMLLSSVPPSEPQPDAYFRYTNCTPTPYECGSLKFDLDYPFSADGVNRPDYCSYPGHRLFCQNVSLFINMNTPSTAFQVTSIDYGNNLLTVVDLGSVSQFEACLPPRAYRNTSIDTTMFMYTDQNQFLSVYVNCSAKSSLLRATDIFSCTTGGRSYYRVDNTVLPDNLGVCSTTLLIPFNSTIAGSLTAGINSSIGGAVGGGFGLRWKAGTGWCSDCKASGGRCGFDSTPASNQTCYCPAGPTAGSCSSASGGGFLNKRRHMYTIASTSSGLLACLLFFALLLGYRRYRSRKESIETPRIKSFLEKNGTMYPKRYTYAQVKKMTKTFAEKLGQGGFGFVYRGSLSDGRQIAVKMLKDSKAGGEDFINEVVSIGKTSHVNIVTFLGFCLEGSKRALIYDYMPNASLERYTFNGNSKGENTLSWGKLFDIAVGVARGLEYLHRGCNTRIVHFDIKPHNILLDHDFCPKISDFGLAKLCVDKGSAISIGGARGTIGYIAPEVFSKQFGVVSSKSDVYSYGMMVLEMVGAKNKKFSAHSQSSSQYFPQWIYEHLDEYCVSASEINDDITGIVKKMIMVGLWCVQVSATDRPTMTRVVEMLEGNTSSLELPPKGFLSS